MATIKKYQEGLKENMVGFTNELTKVFPDLEVTSAYRPGAKTKQGRPSRHGSGEAVDISNRKDIYDYLWNTKEGISLLNKYNVGVLDETSPEMLAKTGGTGKHYHIGQDSTIVPKAKQRYKELVGEEKPTTTITNFDIPIDSSNFASVPDVPQKEEKTKAEEALNTLKEKEFVQQYKSFFTEQKAPEQQEQPQQVIQPTDVQGIFNEVNQFVEAQQGGTPISKDGVYTYPGQEVIVPTSDGRITMSKVTYPILGIDEYGNSQMMMPGEEYQFKGKTIHEHPQLTDKEKAFLKALNRK